MFFLRDINAHSLIWNLHCQKKKFAKPLKNLIEKYDLLISFKLERTTKITIKELLIIDLALLMLELGFLRF